MNLTIKQHFTSDQHPFHDVSWEKRHVKLQREDGSTAFDMVDAEFPVFWSERASTIVASKYFRVVEGKREISVRQMIVRVAHTIANWGWRDGYFDAETSHIFEFELCYILLHQMASFNSPVWFNVGVQDKPQCSACQPGHALISTPHGMIPIKEIVDKQMIGCRVFDRWEGTNVIAAQANGEKEVFRVTLSNGQFIEATADHTVLSVKRRRTQPEWVRVDALLPGMRLHLYPHVVSNDLQCDAIVTSQAALAGWLLTDGFVGQYTHGTNQSLTVEFETINDDEFIWVTDHLSKVFPSATPHITNEVTQDTALTYRRLRMYGEQFRVFVNANKLMERKAAKSVPNWLYDAPLNAVVAFLRSVFQADGYVVQRGNSAFIGLQSVSQILIEGLQLLLLRLGIYSRVLPKQDKRANRLDGYQLSIGMQSERQRFADFVGFISAIKSEKLQATLDVNGKHIGAIREEEVVSVTSLGFMPVYDIQTGSGNYLSNNIVVHNCFILDVEDNMESILEWYTTEGLIFKNGSGAGVNVSKIRAKNEPLSSGGKASGPVSFMRGADTNASVIKSGGNTRRAAKALLMDVEHPDIEEFIWCKAKAEKLGRILTQAGYKDGLEEEVREFIPFQNANNSVSVSDEFMKWATGQVAQEMNRLQFDANPLTGVNAQLLRQIAQAAWKCGDPGLFFRDTVNKWHTTPSRGKIVSCNPCFEFVRPPDEACNLASINLLRYLRDDNSFDSESFCHTVDVLITAMDIIVDRSSYPTPQIAQNSYDYRSLGLGYTNLGALLMANGVAYDSQPGRRWAAEITSLMTGRAYLQSAKLAQAQGAFVGFAADGDEMLAVIDQHANDLTSRATNEWWNAKALGKEHGFRNCQVTLLAPTGTISFMMDCDTTGIEPCLGLIQHKKLVGGGSVNMVSTSVVRGLKTLGYDDITCRKIQVELENTGSLAYSVEHNHLHLVDYPVFATALGDSTLSWEAHVKMVAAVQPFLSGAVSKTINMPAHSTVEDIEQAFVMAWKLGLKSVAVYRDGCKAVQPVTVQSNAQPQTFEEYSKQFGPADVQKLQRKRLPNDRPALNHKFTIGGHEGYLNVGLYEETNTPGELFITMAKEGSTVRGLMETIGVLTSLLLQYGVPLQVLTDKLRNTRFEPAGFTGNKAIPMAHSVVDYIFKWLAHRFLGEKVSEAPDHHKEMVLQDAILRSAAAASSTTTIATPFLMESLAARLRDDAPYCAECGTEMGRRAGSCFVCESCGATSGCS